MDETIGFVRAAYAALPEAVGVIVASELPITTPDRPAQKRRLKTVVETARSLIKQGEPVAAKTYLRTYEWPTPQTVRWCDNGAEATLVIERIGAMRNRQNRGGGDAIDYRLEGQVILVFIWRD